MPFVKYHILHFPLVLLGFTNDQWQQSSNFDQKQCVDICDKRWILSQSRSF